MGSTSPELLAELLPLAIYAVLASALTIGGVMVEYASVQYLLAGDAMVAAWTAAIGGLLLYAGIYGLGYRKVLSSVRSN